ncbi:hypothetical protein BC826DRAFT_157258 [Russula brevipes]|nr:hypothetical protein BC826DRAFT_157258 [Russula brevipes]
MPRVALKRRAFSFHCTFSNFPGDIGDGAMVMVITSLLHGCGSRHIRGSCSLPRNARARLPLCQHFTNVFHSCADDGFGGGEDLIYNIWGFGVANAILDECANYDETSSPRNGSINVTPRLCHRTYSIAQTYHTLCLASGISH